MESFGPWQLESLIAGGGLGEIWRARRPGGDPVALKRLHTHLARNDEGLAQFTLEQRLATTLPHHPNVVRASEAGDVDGRPYVAMEIAPGEDLRRMIAPPVFRSSALASLRRRSRSLSSRRLLTPTPSPVGV